MIQATLNYILCVFFLLYQFPTSLEKKNVDQLLPNQHQ